jgi:hypothetical protein
MKYALRAFCLSAVSLVLALASARAQTVSPPEILGTLVGPGATHLPAGVGFYGADLGWTFVHRGEQQILFGDTWATARSVCNGVPTHDDSQGTIPLRPPGDAVPSVVFTTQKSDPTQLSHLFVYRDGESLSMGYGQVPITAYSDGDHAVGIFGRGDFVRCEPPSPGAEPACTPPREDRHAVLDSATGGGLRCEQSVGECLPLLQGIDSLCDLGTKAGCLPTQTCTPATGYCVDPTSSQNDGRPETAPLLVAHKIDFGFQDPDDPTTYRSVATWRTNKFLNLTARTVRRFAFGPRGNDYRPGGGALLVFGRPGYVAEQGREARLYLMVHALPMKLDASGHARFRPWVYAGVNPKTGWPRWTPLESKAQPLAMDGVVGGDPHEPYPIVAQLAVSYVGEPIKKWVLLYGGDVNDFGLIDPAHARPGPVPGAMQLRFADHPWGPWSPPQPHLGPGSPDAPGTPYGPGGVLYHYACVDQPGAPCARTDPSRPFDAFLPGCPSVSAGFDIGRFYGANIIDAWTRPDGHGGVDMLWNASTWNPYAVILLKTNLRPERR